MQRQPSQRSSAVEVLRDGYEADSASFKLLHQPREIEQRAAEAVDFIHQHAIDGTRLHLHQQISEGRPVHARATETSVVVVLGQYDPACLALAQNIGFRRLALRVQGIEILFEPFIGRLARVYGAPQSTRYLV